MEGKDYKKAQVISFLSGKGGAGKTSVAIGISYLLNDAGFKVLLIDFDFATNGASYFYKYLYPSYTKVIGIYELINKQDIDLNKILPDIHNISLKVKEGLYFVPSRVNFSKKLPLRDSIIVKESDLKSFLFSLIRLCRGEYDFIIIDNQAGSNLTSKVAASVSDKVIIVSELDPISSDAVDTLLIQIGEVFPEYRRHLINKLDIRESKDYKNLNVLFQSMNRLPPLPFDFEVRSAFASRQIPININRPTTFLIALFNTVKSFLPEYKDQLDEYGKKILDKFSQYQDKINSLLDRKKELEKEIEVLRKKREKRKLKIITVLSTLGMYLGIALAIIGIVWNEFLNELLNEFLTWPKLFLSAIGTFIAAISIFYLFIRVEQFKERTEDIIRKEKIDTELSEINKEIEQYKSLMLTRTKEFLLYFEKLTGSHDDSPSSV